MKKHEHGDASAQSRGKLWLAVALTSVTFVAEAATGWWTNSIALLSDAEAERMSQSRNRIS